MPRFAAIDVGSNALRLRIIETSAPDGGDTAQLSLITRGPASTRAPAKGRARTIAPADDSQVDLEPMTVEPRVSWREVANLRAPVRLGSEVFVSGRLTPASIGQACAALREFREKMDEAKVDAYRATATSAVREASNGSTLVERARREAGIELEVIEGIEEARLIQLAVTRRMALSDKTALLADVGGGSTEVTVLENGRDAFSMSLPMGTVRLLETFLKGARTLDKEHERLLEEAVDRALKEAMRDLRARPFQLFIGTGGSVDALADLCPKKGGYMGYPRAIDVPEARALWRRMAAMSTAERREAFNLRPDRADTIVPAGAIFLMLAERFQMPAIITPAVGLKEGVLEEVVDRFFDVWDEAGEAESVLSACMRLGRRYQFDEEHGKRVAGFAAQLFDDLKSIHAYGARERLLLRAAALLHDVGDFVRYDAHHKHSYYIVQHSDIMGLSPDERALVANIARYHRKSLPDPSHPNFRDLDRDARSKVRGLAAILRIADALDREHRGKVHRVRGVVERAKGILLLFLTGEAERELEEWTVKAKSDLLKDFYALDILIAPGEP